MTKREAPAVQEPTPETPETPVEPQDPSATIEPVAPVAEVPPADPIADLEPQTWVEPVDKWPADVEYETPAPQPKTEATQPTMVNGKFVGDKTFDEATGKWVLDPAKTAPVQTETLLDRIKGAFPNERQQAVFTELLNVLGYDDGK